MIQIEMFPTAISSPPVIHVSRSVSPVSAAERKILATSGRTSYALLHPKDPLGAFSRMFMVTSHWASTKCCLTWKPKATPQGRLLFQLAVSMRPTEETGSGSSPRKFAPTPTASDHIERKSTSTEKLNPLTGKSVSLDRFVKFWPTAEVQQSGQPEMWATPAAADSKGTTGGGQGKSLRTDVRMWPTPNASNVKGAYQDMAKLSEREKAGRQKNLQDVVRMWPTPLAQEARHGVVTNWELTTNHAATKGSLRVAATKSLWPTPTTQDAKNNGGPSQHNRNTKPLNAEVGGSLNPQWVEWLMGYPEGWTDLKD